MNEHEDMMTEAVARASRRQCAEKHRTSLERLHDEQREVMRPKMFYWSYFFGTFVFLATAYVVATKLIGWLFFWK